MKALIIILLSCTFLCNADEVLTRDERIVALTLLGEARGEGKKGMLAVACVIQRRTWESAAYLDTPNHSRGLSPAGVCLQPYQFSIWNAGKGKVKREQELYYLWKSPSMMYARELARQLNKNWKGAYWYEGFKRFHCIKDITNGANHYCNIKENPKWAKGLKPVAVIGNHKFYKLY